MCHVVICFAKVVKQGENKSINRDDDGWGTLEYSQLKGWLRTRSYTTNTEPPATHLLLATCVETGTTVLVGSTDIHAVAVTAGVGR